MSDPNRDGRADASDTVQPAEPEDVGASAPTVLSVGVRVTRTGGIAGLRREWEADAPPDEAPRWVALIDECPWDDPATPGDESRDRYVWFIRARTPASEREAELPDRAVTGPWRQLVDEVRRVAASEAPTAPTPTRPAPRRAGDGGASGGDGDGGGAGDGGGRHRGR